MQDGPSHTRAIRTDGAVLKVLDLGSMVGGPFAATLLGDLGAEVIKVEAPGHGDYVRWVSSGEGYTLLWQVHGRNKRSVTLNLKSAAGQNLLRRLAQWADVLIENNRPGVLDRLGLGYAQLSEVNPRLVYLSVSGYGQTGPYRERPSYEWAGAAFGGLTAVTGFIDRPPVMPGIAITDHTSAMFGVIGVLEAIRRRDLAGAEGRGALVDVALYEPVIRMSNAYIASAFSGPVQAREGSFPSRQAEPHSKLGYVYETSDGRFIANFMATRPQFERCVDAIGRPELKDDPRFATELLRMEENYYVLDEALRTWVKSRTFEAAMAGLVAADQPVAPVNGASEILEDPHIASRGNMVELKNVRGETVAIPGVLPHISTDDGAIRFPAEELGASNAPVYQGLLGLSEAEMKRLADEGVI